MGKARVTPRQGGIILLALLILAVPALVAAQATPEATPAASPGASPVATPAAPRYPDLAAMPPDDLYFSTEVLADGQPHQLLRFSTSVTNTGEGPLELTGSTEPGAAEVVTQRVYDAPLDGRVALTIPLAADFHFHPEHHHFHLADFARYDLFRVGEGDELVPTGAGGKQSSCLLDTFQVQPEPQQAPAYNACELERQGISVGWGDSYAASLPGQWIDLAGGTLADGDYVLRYTVDPLGQLAEDDRTANNVAETRFTVRDGVLVGRPEPPRCAIVGESSGVVGSTITLRCTHFPGRGSVQVYWDAWDPWDNDAEPVATFRGADAEAVTVTFAAPPVAPGAWSITAVGYDFEERRYISATVIYGIEPGPPATPVASPVASPVVTPVASPPA